MSILVSVCHVDVYSRNKIVNGFFFNSHFIVLKVSWWCLQTCLHLYAFSLLSIFSIHHLSVKICFVFCFVCLCACCLLNVSYWGVDLRHIRPLKAHLVWQPLFKILGAWRRWSHITSIFAMIHCERRWIPQIVGSGWNQGNTARAAAPSLRQHRQKETRPKQGLKSYKPTKALPDLKSGGRKWRKKRSTLHSNGAVFQISLNFTRSHLTVWFVKYG